MLIPPSSPHTHAHTHTLFHSPVTPFSLCVLCLAFYMNGKRVKTHSKHTTNIMTDFLSTLREVSKPPHTKQQPCLVSCAAIRLKDVEVLLQTAPYLVRNIHHQVIALVSVAVLQQKVQFETVKGTGRFLNRPETRSN